MTAARPEAPRLMTPDLARLYVALHLARASYWQHRVALRIYALAGIDHALATIAGWEERS